MPGRIKSLVIIAFTAFSVSIFAAPAGGHLSGYARSSAIRYDPQAGLYIQNCARCHGATGRGDTDLGRKLFAPNLREEAKSLSIAKITRVITNGKGDMPAFGKKLSKKQIASLARYIRTL